MLSLNRLGFLIESMIKMSRLESEVIQLRLQMNDLNDTVLLAIRQVQKNTKWLYQSCKFNFPRTKKAVILGTR